MTNVIKSLSYLFAAWLVFHTNAVMATSSAAEWWISPTASGELKIHLYFFWARHCPHCREAKPFVESLGNDYPWLQLHSLEVSGDRDNAMRYTEMAAALGQEARFVPAFMACGQMITGYDHAEGAGRYLRNLVEDCHQKLSESAVSETVPATNIEASSTIRVPFIGTLDAKELSLPVLTLVLGGLDAFNPCAFFVLLFLLSLLVHAHDRKRMMLIGGIFIFFSGFIYFVFMAAWLNVFLLLGELQIITLVAGTLAAFMGLVNIKDYFWFQRGLSLSISDQAKPNLFRRMRSLVAGERLPSLILGAITLAIAANSYELLCTAGFPMVYTRTLTLNELSTGGYYLYLLFYNIIYIIPLLVIMLAFTMTLGSRKLQEREGRILKFLSGTMMLGLGLMLLLYPEGLNNASIAVMLLIAAIGLTAVVVWVEKMVSRKPIG